MNARAGVGDIVVPKGEKKSNAGAQKGIFNLVARNLVWEGLLATWTRSEH